MARKNPRASGALDSMLSADQSLEGVLARTAKRVLATQIARAMRRQRLSKNEMARRMRTSRSALDRLLDESDTGLTLDTMVRAATALGCRITVKLMDVAGRQCRM